MKKSSFSQSRIRRCMSLLLALLLLWALSGCKSDPLDPSTGNVDVKKAVRAYEKKALDYDSLDREPEQPLSPIDPPRYALGEDGVWRSSSADDGPAVLMLTGDLMCQTRQQEAAKTDAGYDFRGSFYYVRPVFSDADLVIGNLESTLSESAPYMAEQPTVEEKPHLNAPAVFLEALRNARYDMVVMSNNHNCDAGVKGVYDTLDRVEEYGLMHTGTFRSNQDPRFVLVEVNGIRFGVMSYSTGFNGKDSHFTDEGVQTLLNPYDPDTAAKDAAAAREAGAEYLLVYIHWGTEYETTPDDNQYRIAQELANAGFDLIVGSHPHALQPFGYVERSDGQSVPVMYSLGNFISHQKKAVTKDTIILQLTFDRDEQGRVVLVEKGYIPCRVFTTFQKYDYAVLPMTSPYNQGIRSRYFADSLASISEILGDELPMLGVIK